MEANDEDDDVVWKNHFEKEWGSVLFLYVCLVTYMYTNR